MGSCLSIDDNYDDEFNSMNNIIDLLKEEIEQLKIDIGLRNTKIDLLEQELYIYKKYY